METYNAIIAILKLISVFFVLGTEIAYQYNSDKKLTLLGTIFYIIILFITYYMHIMILALIAGMTFARKYLVD